MAGRTKLIGELRNETQNVFQKGYVFKTLLTAVLIALKAYHAKIQNLTIIKIIKLHNMKFFIRSNFPLSALIFLNILSNPV